MTANNALIKICVSLLIVLIPVYIFGGGEKLGNFFARPLSNGVFLMAFLIGVVPYILLHLQDMDEHKKDRGN